MNKKLDEYSKDFVIIEQVDEDISTGYRISDHLKEYPIKFIIVGLKEGDIIEL